MTTAVSRRAHTDGVLAALLGAGLLAAVSRKPDAVPELPRTKAPARAYGTVHPLPFGRGGPVADPDADVAFTFQITCVAASPEGAEQYADDAEAALQGVTVSGRTVTRLEPLADAGVRRDDDANPSAPLFYATPQWRLHTTPA